MIVAGVPVPDFRLIGFEEIEQITAVFVAGVVIGAVEILDGVDAAVVREEDGVGDGGIEGETRVFENAAVEDELEETVVGAIPGVRTVVGFLAQTMVG